MLKKLLKIFKTISFFKKRETEILIFDNFSLAALEKNILKDYNYFVLSNRIDEFKFYISISILKYFIKNCIKFFLNRKINILDIYLISIIEVISPKLVITTIDNSFQFSKITKFFPNKNTNFMAIQVSMKHQRKFHTYIQQNNLINKNLNEDYFYQKYLLMGEHDLIECRENKVYIENFSFIGSLYLSNFLSSKYKTNTVKKFDICLISDEGAYNDRFTKKKFKLPNFDAIKLGYQKLVIWTINVSLKNKLKFHFIFKRKHGTADSIAEINYYRDFLSKNEFNYLISNSSFNSNSNPYNSYQKVFDSKVSIAVSSTLLREALVTKNKILSCNLTDIDMFNFPINGICSISNCNQLDFNKKLLEVLEMNFDDYEKKIEKKTNYLIHYSSPNNTFKSVKAEINKFL